jgi:hypothetical protein
VPWWVLALGALVLVTVPLAALSVVSRVRFARLPESFRCRLSAAASLRRGETRWRRHRTRARWVNDVLLIQDGALRTGVRVLPAWIPPGASVRTVLPDDVRRLGRHPVALRLMTGEGPVDLAVAESSRLLLVGPFLTAAIPGLPRAPRDHGT